VALDATVDEGVDVRSAVEEPELDVVPVTVAEACSNE
jgi:hypothetical protein